MTSETVNRLAQRCAYSTQTSEWERFVRLATPVIALTAWRVAQVWGESASSSTSEIVQDVFLKLCEDDRRILREFQDRGSESFLKLLRVVAASVATDYFRRIHAEKRGGNSTTLPLDLPEVADEITDANSTQAVEWPALIAQLDGLLRLFPDAISDRDRTLFWLYYRQGMTAKAIAAIPAIGLGAKGVESALLRIARLLRDTIRNGKPTPVPITPTPKSELEKGFSPVIAINSMKPQ